MLTVRTGQRTEVADELAAAVRWATLQSDQSLSNLIGQLNYLRCYGGGDVSTDDNGADLRLDFAPLSFGWAGRSVGLIGGLIYHGPDPKDPSAAAQNLSVELQGPNFPHWSIHT